MLIVGLGLLSGIQLSRALGPNGRGSVAATLLWPGLLVYLGAIGLSQAVVVFCASAADRRRVSAVFSTAAVLAVGLSTASSGLGILLIPLLLRTQSLEVVKASRVFLLMIPAGMLSGLVAAVLQGRCSFLKLNALRLILPIGYVLGLAVLTLKGELSVMNVSLLQLALSYLTLVAGALVLMRDGISFSPSSFDLGTAKQLFAFGAKAYIGTLSGTLNQRLDQALLAAWFPAAQLGLYSVASSAAGATDTIGFAFRTVASGRIAQRATTEDKFSELRAILARFWLVLLLGTAALAACLPKLVPLLYGAGFRAAVLPAELLLIAQIFYAAKNLLISAAEAFGDSWLGSKAELIGLAPTVLLLVILLPKLGILGAALASVTAYGVQFTVIAWGFSRKELEAKQGPASSIPGRKPLPT